jgi:hypothetical protein
VEKYVELIEQQNKIIKNKIVEVDKRIDEIQLKNTIIL